MVFLFLIQIGCVALVGNYYLIVTQQEMWFHFFNAQSLVFFSGYEFTNAFLAYFFFSIFFLTAWCFYVKSWWHTIMFLIFYCWQVYFSGLFVDFISFTFVDYYLPVYVPQFIKWWNNVLVFFIMQHIFFLMILFPVSLRIVTKATRALYIWSTTVFCLYYCSFSLWVSYLVCLGISDVLYFFLFFISCYRHRLQGEIFY
jgi:hypothetical protein